MKTEEGGELLTVALEECKKKLFEGVWP